MNKEYFIVQMKKDYNSKMNDRVYRKNERLMVYGGEYAYIVINNNHDFIPLKVCDIVHKLSVEVIEIENTDT